MLADQGIAVSRSATLEELGETVHSRLAVDPGRFVRAVGAARYGRPEDAPAAATRARRELRELLRLIRSRLTWAARIRGLLSIRSLGFGE